MGASTVGMGVGVGMGPGVEQALLQRIQRLNQTSQSKPTTPKPTIAPGKKTPSPSTSHTTATAPKASRRGAPSPASASAPASASSPASSLSLAPYHAPAPALAPFSPPSPSPCPAFLVVAPSECLLLQQLSGGARHEASLVLQARGGSSGSGGAMHTHTDMHSMHISSPTVHTEVLLATSAPFLRLSCSRVCLRNDELANVRVLLEPTDQLALLCAAVLSNDANTASVGFVTVTGAGGLGVFTVDVCLTRSACFLAHQAYGARQGALGRLGVQGQGQGQGVTLAWPLSPPLSRPPLSPTPTSRKAVVGASASASPRKPAQSAPRTKGKTPSARTPVLSPSPSLRSPPSASSVATIARALLLLSQAQDAEVGQMDCASTPLSASTSTPLSASTPGLDGTGTARSTSAPAPITPAPHAYHSFNSVPSSSKSRASGRGGTGGTGAGSAGASPALDIRNFLRAADPLETESKGGVEAGGAGTEVGGAECSVDSADVKLYSLNQPPSTAQAPATPPAKKVVTSFSPPTFPGPGSPPPSASLRSPPITPLKAGVCFRREVVDFGAVARGSLTRANLDLCNHTDQETTIFLGDPLLPFVLLHNQVTLRPRSYARVPVRFIPTGGAGGGGGAEGQFRAELVAQSADGQHHTCIVLTGAAF
ncbi:hypothetical protein B484DRAFT_11122 [Ochromonadaceae sp. CCMP2298]|nr:hypothetical protein B484DRAFT_11122 [Ochromonadaceae sp. CCMP2298]